MVDNEDSLLDDERNIVGQVIDFTHTKKARQWFVMALLLVVSTCLFFATPPFNYIGIAAWLVLVFQLRESK